MSSGCSSAMILEIMTILASFIGMFFFRRK